MDNNQCVFHNTSLIVKLLEAKGIIKGQETYITELEQQVDDLQKALDTVLLNKCRTRKVKVKVYGRTQDVRKNSNR